MDKLEEIRLRTMANLSSQCGNFTISPLTLREIVDYGYEKHNQHLHTLSFNIASLLSPQDLDKIDADFSLYDLALLDSGYLAMFIEALLYFLKETEIHFDDDLGFILGDVNDEKILTKESFSELVEIIKIQNNYQSIEDNDYNPANTEADKIKQKLLAGRKRVQEVKARASQEDSLSLLDLISIIAANANGISIFNVFEMNMVQFNDQFNRMKLLDDYQVNIQALMHGADSKSIELKHWMTKIK
ncbi:hypothetical protein EEL31_10415 [Brevibacillus laterosporus]|nr:hypothetical protein [Brevibacillus laterosporus]TPG68902.1 hypothetical protein EEL31_10415 [Brevibacillus laterosporus]